MLADVSSKLMGQFVENLERDVLEPNPPRRPQPTPIPMTSPPRATPTDTGVRKIEGPAAKPIDLLDAAGGSVTKRLVPVGIGLVVLFVLWRILRTPRTDQARTNRPASSAPRPASGASVLRQRYARSTASARARRE